MQRPLDLPERRLAHLTAQLANLEADHARQVQTLNQQIRALKDEVQQQSRRLDELAAMRANLAGPVEAMRLLGDARRRLHVPFTIAGLCARLRAFDRRLKAVAQVVRTRPASSQPAALIHCDHPRLDVVARVGGVLRVEGWAVVPGGLANVLALVDEQPAGEITCGQPRPDLAARFPGVAGAEGSGFRGYLDIRAFPPGRHRLTLRIVDGGGESHDLGGEIELDHGHVEVVMPLPDWDQQYQFWLEQQAPTPDRLRGLAGAASRLPYRPAFSLLMPVYNPPVEFFRLAIRSVLAQVYPEWELCLVDDASTDPQVRPLLAEIAASDPRIRLACLDQNHGIAGASNAALAIATGEFVGLLDQDDELWPNALYEYAKLLNERPDTDLIYSDEDKISPAGRHEQPFFKPGWSPDLLTSMMYTCHFSVYRRSLVLEVGGFRAEFDGSQDYDLALRVAEKTDRVEHIPTILYSWRVIPGSAAEAADAKPYAVNTARRALTEAAIRRGQDVAVELGFAPGRWRFRYRIAGSPPVAIVMPTAGRGGRLPLLKATLLSLLSGTSYRTFELLVVDNAVGDGVRDLVASLQAGFPNLRHLDCRVRPFNFSAIVNAGVTQVAAPYLVLLNDDITIAEPGWLEAMLEHAQRPEVGVVGAKLLYADSSVQHAGVATGIGVIAGHLFKHYPPGHHGYLDLIDVVRNVTAVTFACAMVRRTVYAEVGGLDAEHLGVAFNDVDFCLRVRARGYRIVYTPHAVLYHHEFGTGRAAEAAGETAFMQAVWPDAIRRDPFYNPNLTRRREDCSLAVTDQS